MPVFDKTLHSLQREDVQKLLNDALSEPLLWETKGTEIHRDGILKNVCAFANGNQTGYLILGAEEDPWSLPGYEFKANPTSWISDLIVSNLQPIPVFDVREIPGEVDGRVVTVVEVQPLATTPCIAGGTIFERVPGKTLVVKDPTRLATLVRRGQVAHQGARAATDEMARELISFHKSSHETTEENAQFALALGGTDRPPDISSLLFSEAYERSITNAARDFLIRSSVIAPDPSVARIAAEMTQSSAIARISDVDGRGHRRYWWIQVRWDGTVGIHYSSEERHVKLGDLVVDPIAAALRASADLLRRLEVRGFSYLALQINGAASIHDDDGRTVVTEIGRGPYETVDEEPFLRSIEREFARSAGKSAYETPPEGWPPPDVST